MPVTAQQMLKVAGVGAGYFSRFHYDSWARMDRARCVAVCDTDLAKAQSVHARAYDDLAIMLSEQQPDILDVILPPAGQTDAIRAALQTGTKWIICQKPFCMSLAQAHALTAEADAAGAKLIIHENFRFQPWYRVIATELQNGALGQLHQATFRLRPGDGQGPDAYLARQPSFQQMPRFLVQETAVHWIDTFRFLLGNPTAVYADLRQINPAIAGEDAGHILFDHPNGVRALFDGNRHLDHAADNLRRTMGEALFEGTEGTLTLRGDGAVMFRNFGASAEREVLPPDPFDGFGGDCVHALQSHVVHAILEGTEVENTARDYLDVRMIEDAIYTSAATGTKQPLSYPLRPALRAR